MGTDNDLQPARAGDPDAGNAIGERVRKAVEQVVRLPRWAAVRPTEADREDLVQHVTAKVLSLLAKFHYRGKGSLERYVHQIADLAMHDVEKAAKAKKRDAGMEVHVESDVLGALHSPNAHTRLTPSGDLIQQENVQHLLRGLTMIPEVEAKALRMHYWEGLKVIEIAARLEITVDTAKKLLAQARQHLKNRLHDSDGAP
jgi:RNA polymerase sigma factor (sigma-70 family)